MEFLFEEKPQTIQSQYAASPNLVSTVEIFTSVLPNKDIELFYNSVFNIDTAEGVGLDIWGRIIGIGRQLEVKKVDDYFGFSGSGESGFNNREFYYKGVTNVYNMTDSAYRQYLLLTKAFANISDATTPSLNYILSQLFKGKTAYVLPAGIMHIRFVFEFNLSALERSIFNLGLLTHGAGVGYEYYEIDKKNTFGFDGSGLTGFNQGTFQNHKIKKVD